MTYLLVFMIGVFCGGAGMLILFASYEIQQGDQ